MSDPLDVSLRVRMRYEAGDAAAKAIGDVEKVRSTADRLGAGSPGDRLGQGLRSVSGQAQAAERDILKVAATSARLGGGDGTARLATGLKDAGQAAGTASREVSQLGQVAARFGAVSTVSSLASDLRSVQAPAQAAARDILQVAATTARLGGGDGTARLATGLKDAGQAAGSTSREVTQLGQVAARFGAVSTVSSLASDLRGVQAPAQAAEREILKVAATTARLGGSDGTARLATSLKDAGQAAGSTSREVTQLGQVAARFGAVSTVSYLARDLRAVHAPAQGAKRDLNEVREAADKIGRGAGIRELEADLQKASRRADELERRLGGVGRRNAGGQSGRGEHHAFANEAIRASGLGLGGARLGMGAAAAGGLAAGAGIAAIGGTIAMATGNAITFEHAMTEVKKAVNDTPEGIKALERDILGFSRASGIAKTEVAALVAQAGYLNVPRDQLKGFAEIATKAAIGFQMRPEETGEALGHLRNAYGLKDNAQLRSAGDAINKVGDNVGTRERDVLNYLNRTSGYAGMLKIPLAKNAAIGGSIMSLGVAPEVAATGFDSVAGRLANANLEGKDFQRGLRAIHMTGRGAKAMMQQDATGGLIEVLQRLKDLPETKRTNAIRDIAGEGNVAAVSRMVESLDKMKEALELVSDPSKYAGSLEKTFKIFSSDTQAQIKRTEAAISSFGGKVGAYFSPAIETAARAVERWFNGLNKAIDRAERADELATKLAKGGALNPAEQAEVDANPRLKSGVEQRKFYHEQTDAIEAGRQRLIAPPTADAKPVPSMDDAREAFRKRAEEFERRRRGEGPPAAPVVSAGQKQLPQPPARDAKQAPSIDDAREEFRRRAEEIERRQPSEAPPVDQPATPPVPPGFGKRSDLEDGVKASLASYHEEVDRSLTRTERLARDMGKRIAEDLTIRPKVEDAAFRGFGLDGARVERASLGGGRFGGGQGSGLGGGGGGLGGGGGGLGGGGSSGASGGARRLPGRFGGAIPDPRGGSGRLEGGPAGGGGSRGGSSEPAQDGPTESIPGTLNPRLAGSRKALMSELDRDPALRRDVLKTASMENRGSPIKMQAVLESMVNRSKMNGYSSLRQAIHSGFYGPVNRGGLSGALSEKDKSDGEAALKQVREGSNAIGYRTDQGMLTDPGARRYMREPDHSGHRVIGGENFFYMGQKGREWARRQEEADAGQSNPAAADASRPGQQPAAAGGSKFDPLGGAARRYSSGFGMRDHPVLGGRRMHQGQDMAAPGGTGVMAMEGGKVSSITRHGDVTVTHPDGSTKTYRHIAPDGVKMGQAIEGGQQIGRLRQHDPRSTGPHLHMEATDPQGRRYDPMPEIREANRLRDGAVAARSGAAEDGLRQIKPWARAEPEARSPRFMDPSTMQLKPGAGGEASAGGAGAGRLGLGGPSVTQHFHGGFDAHEVGRRAQLEQNREVRRTMAGSLHDVGSPRAA